jgi:hypothetical protein
LGFFFFGVVRDTFWLEGTRKKQHWQVLKIDRAEAAELNLVEDPVIYSESECKRLLNRVAEGDKLTGGLQLVTKADDIVDKSLILSDFENH